MSRATQTAAQTQTQTQNSTQNQTPAEKIGIGALPMGTLKAKDGSERATIRLHSLSFLAGNDEHPATFGGFMTDFADPQTGEIRGSGDSVALSFFRQTAIRMAKLTLGYEQDAEIELQQLAEELKERGRDALLLCPRLDADPAAELSLYRDETGRAKFVASDSAVFGGAHRWLRAAPKLSEGAI